MSNNKMDNMSYDFEDEMFMSRMCRSDYISRDEDGCFEDNFFGEEKPFVSKQEALDREFNWFVTWYSQDQIHCDMFDERKDPLVPQPPKRFDMYGEQIAPTVPSLEHVVLVVSIMRPHHPTSMLVAYTKFVFSDGSSEVYYPAVTDELWDEISDRGIVHVVEHCHDMVNSRIAYQLYMIFEEYPIDPLEVEFEKLHADSELPF